MRTTIVASAGGALLAAAVLAVTVATPPAESQAAARPVQLSPGVLAGTSAADVSPSTTGTQSGSVSSSTGVTAIPASSTATRPAPPPLTDGQKALIDDYLGAHPGRAQKLADTAARWKAFADANPALAAELEKVAALPPAERKAELSGWFADHPQEKAAFQDWVKQTHDERADRRHDRRDRRHDRRDRRHERRDNRGSTTPAPTTSGSAQTTATQA